MLNVLMISLEAKGRFYVPNSLESEGQGNNRIYRGTYDLKIPKSKK